MSRRQFGNVEKLPSGRWRARYNIDGRWFSAGRTFETKGEAGRFLDRIRTELDRGEWRDPRLGKTLLQDWAETFMSTKADLAPRTASGYRSLLRSRILPALGTRQLIKIRPSDIQRWLADMANDGLSASRRRQALGLLSRSWTPLWRTGSSRLHRAHRFRRRRFPSRSPTTSPRTKLSDSSLQPLDRGTFWFSS